MKSPKRSHSRQRAPYSKSILVLAASLMAGGTFALGEEPPGNGLGANAARFIPDEILVQFKAGATDEQVADAYVQGGLSLKKLIKTPAMHQHGKPGISQLKTRLGVPAAIRALSNHPGVQFAEPNWIIQTQAESNDPLYLDGSLWGTYGDDLDAPIGPATTTNAFGSQAEKAWAAGVTGASHVFVGIVDEGIQPDHPDLVANIWTNAGEIAGNGIDDDGNGYIDDIHGWNTVSDNGITYEAGYDAHGTHVAGTIGATGGNGVGVAGVNWNVTMISAKALGRDGSGTVADAIQAIDYLTNLKTTKGLNIVALNHSWVTRGFSQGLLDSITRAAQAGILSAAAAGNANLDNDSNDFYPANFDTTATAGYDAVISVAYINKEGLKSPYSNYGATSVDLGAPGASIYSTISGSAYGMKSGTSMATPHVSGAIALYASTHPGEAAPQIRADLLSYGIQPTVSLEGNTATGGRLDVAKLLTAPASELPAPSAPANVQTTAVSAGRVDVAWGDMSNGELGFAIERSTDGVNYTLADTVGANATGYSDRTVRPGTTYLYRVAAYNAGSRSEDAYSATSVTTPSLALPAAPANLTGSALAKGGISLSWTDRASNEQGFLIERKTGTAAYQLLANVAANTTKFTDATTAARTTYTYRVSAINASGSSPASNEATIKSK